MQAVTAKGVTPASNSPTDIATAIANIGESFYNAELVHRNNKTVNGSKNLTVSNSYTLKENGYYLAFLAGYGSTLNTSYTCENTATLTYNSSTSYTTDGHVIQHGQTSGGGTIHDYSKYAIFAGTKDKVIAYSKHNKSDYYNVAAATSFSLFKVENTISLLYKNKTTSSGTGSATASLSYNITTSGKYLVIVSSHGASINAGYTDPLTGIKTTIKFNNEIAIDFDAVEKINISAGNNQGSVSSDVKFAFVEGTGTVYAERYYQTYTSYLACLSLELFIFKIG